MGHALLRGNGAGQPLGMFETPAAKSITRAGANAIATADLAKMLADMSPHTNWSATCWFYHSSCHESLLTLEAVQGPIKGSD